MGLPQAGARWDMRLKVKCKKIRLTTARVFAIMNHGDCGRQMLPNYLMLLWLSR